MRGERRAARRISVLLVVSALAIALVVGLPALARHLPADALADRLQDRGLAGVLAFLLVASLATAVGLPRQLVALVAGFAWGATSGVVLALLASLSGCAISVALGGRWLRAPLRRRHPVALAKLERFFARDLFLKTLLLRLQPFGTNLLSNLAAGALAVDRRTFLLASAIGYLPQATVFALVGGGLRVGSSIELIVASVLFVVSLLLGALLWRRHVGADGALDGE